MNVIILSAQIGGGHHSCSKTLKDELASRGIPCEICDVLRLIFFPINWLVKNIELFTCRYFANVNRIFYAHMSEHMESHGVRLIYDILLRICARSLAKKIESKNIDTVVCTNYLAAYILTRAIQDHAVSVKSAFVATDYSREAIMKYTKLDCYFIPSELLADKYVRGNIPREKIVISGIPVAKDFYAEREQKTDVATGGQVLIAGGSAGLGPIKKLVFALAEALPEGARISVVCGRNKKLYRSINRKNKDPRIIAYGYVDNMAELMRGCDVYITKPGGISITEAAASKTPMVLYDSIYGWESNNFNFFVRNGAACPSRTVDEAAKKTAALLKSSGEREKLIGNLSKIRIEGSAEKIVDYLVPR